MIHPWKGPSYMDDLDVPGSMDCINPALEVHPCPERKKGRKEWVKVREIWKLGQEYWGSDSQSVIHFTWIDRRPAWLVVGSCTCLGQAFPSLGCDHRRLAMVLHWNITCHSHPQMDPFVKSQFMECTLLFTSHPLTSLPHAISKQLDDRVLLNLWIY